ncbi:MAG: hypothetical protein J6X44_10965, partial [Thermoguttaceae bacterium]|nr:hypothetical protein [Thermoguttaceae bacterium]
DWNGVSVESNAVLDASEDGSRLSRNLNAMSEQISGTLDDLSERSSTLTERLNNSAQSLQTNVQNSLDSVNEKINNGLETVQNWSQQASNGLTETSNNLTNSISGTIDSVDSGLRNTYDNVTNSLSNAYNNTLDSLQNAGNSLQSGYENVRNALSNGVPNSLQNSGLDGTSSNALPQTSSLSSSDFNSLDGTGTLGSEGNKLTLNANDLNSPSPLNTSGSSPLTREQGIAQNGGFNAGGLGNGNNVDNASNNLLLPANNVGVSNNYENAVGSNSNPDNVGSTNVPSNSYLGVGNNSFADDFSTELPTYRDDNPNGTSTNAPIPVYGSSNVSSAQNGGAYSPNNNQYSQGGYYPNVDSRASGNSSLGVPYANQNEIVPYGNNASYANSRGYDTNTYNPNSYDLAGNVPGNDASSWSALNNAQNNYSNYGYRSSNQADVGTKTRYREYVTKEGDNLLTIAENELGSSSRWSEIKRLNNLRSGATYFEVGTRIKLPVSAKDD